MAPTLFDKPAKPGDLIEIQRGTYEHWAVYVGQNEVVHLIPPTQEDDDVLGLGHLVQYLDSHSAEVKCEKIWKVVGPHSYQVNNMLDEEYHPRHWRDIVWKARGLVGRVLPYNVATYNCEHFVTELRYGTPQSRQVKNVAIGGAAVAGVAVVALGAALFASLLKNDDDDHEVRRRPH